jgi:hypothetical protein
MEKNSFRVRKTFAMTTELIPVYYFRFGMRKTGNTKRGDEKMIEKWHQLEKAVGFTKNNSNNK